jgi:hemolysin III
MNATDYVSELTAEIKPRLRGWLHLGAFPFSLSAGTVLVILAPTAKARISVAIFASTAAVLFGISALYHRGHWSPRGQAILRRLDHCSIFLLIAGTYTPFAVLLLDNRNAEILLTVIWVGALVGVAFRILWLSAPRWLYLPVYITLGWSAVFWLGDFARTAGPAVFTLIVIGGALYSLGAIVYGLKRPNPAPRWFGFHEIFHSCTIAAFAVHYVGISMAVYATQ